MKTIRRHLPLVILAVIIALCIGGIVAAQEKVTLCHAAGRDGTTHYVTLTVGYPAAFGPAGHFYENGTPRAGHEDDYLGECRVDTTTTVVVTTTTQPQVTTTTEPEVTTTTAPEVTTTTVDPGTPPTTTDPGTPTERFLPSTGGSAGALVALAVLVIGLGGIGVWFSKGKTPE